MVLLPWPQEHCFHNNTNNCNNNRRKKESIDWKFLPNLLYLYTENHPLYQFPKDHAYIPIPSLTIESSLLKTYLAVGSSTVQRMSAAFPSSTWEKLLIATQLGVTSTMGRGRAEGGHTGCIMILYWQESFWWKEGDEPDLSGIKPPEKEKRMWGLSRHSFQRFCWETKQRQSKSWWWHSVKENVCVCF